MKENRYDDNIFFQKYSQKSRSQKGLAGGNLVFTVEHPVFTAHGTQDWYYNEKGEILHFPVDDYLNGDKLIKVLIDKRL